MRPVERSEIPGPEEYEAVRPAFRARIFARKRLRRVHLGSHLTFLFEDHDTVLYQILEMLRVEGRWDEEAIEHELRTYNELLGGPGELGCTLLIEIEDPLQRDLVLRKWLDLPEHLYARMEDGRRVRPSYDPRQVGEDRLSSVQYLKFPVGGEVPAALGLDKPGLELEIELSPEVRAALAEDLR